MEVALSHKAKKQLAKAPKHIQKKLIYWISLVKESDPDAVSLRVPGFKDKKLKGAKSDRRAIRLSIQWRAEYKVHGTQDDAQITIEFVEILEVHAHDY